MKMYVHTENCTSILVYSVIHLHPILCDPMDHSPLGFSVHGISEARILEWLAYCTPGDLPDSGIKLESLVSPVLAGRFFTIVPPGKLVHQYL